MSTLSDVTALVRGYVDDQPSAWADDTYLIKFVNAANRRLASDLAAKSIDRLRFRLHTEIYVPAGTTSLSNVLSMAPSNEFTFSDSFADNGGFGVNLWGAAALAGNPSSVLPAQGDPWGTTLATRWTLPNSGPGLNMLKLGTTQQTVASGQYVTGAVWMKAAVPFPVYLGVGGSPVGGTATAALETKINLTADWERYSLTYGPYTPVASSYGGLFLRALLAESSAAQLYLARAKVELSQFDSGDVLTNGFPLTRRPITLPANMLEPFCLYERRPGGDDSEWLPMMGPRWLSVASSTTTLRQWDWRGGEILLLAATEDREVRLDYWGELADYEDPPNAAQPVPTFAVNALAYRVCEMLVRSKGRLDAAQEFAAQADMETSNIVTMEVKARQSVPHRRRPFLGVPRYPATRYPNY